MTEQPFEKRKKAFIDKESHDSELHFKNKVETVKRLGAWSSKLLGFDEQTTGDYTDNLIQNCLITGGLAAVVESVVQDFEDYGFKEDKALVEHKIEIYLEELDEEDGL